MNTGWSGSDGIGPMGGNPRPGTWGPAQWKGLGRTIGIIRREGWPVHAVCLTCGLQMTVDLARIERERGPDFVLWGKSGPCRRLRCTGKVMFMVEPPKSNGAVPML